MEIKTIISIRKKLERKYTRLTLKFKDGFMCKNSSNRYLSISPTQYYYVTNVNPMEGDYNLYKELSNSIHKKESERQLIEEKVLSLIPFRLEDVDCKYFFNLKDFIIQYNFFDLNSYLQQENLKTLKKKDFNRIINLLNRWINLSIEYHYKPNPAEKRISKKIFKKYLES